MGAGGGSDSRVVGASGRASTHLERDALALAHVALLAHGLRVCLGHVRDVAQNHSVLPPRDARVQSTGRHEAGRAAHTRPGCGARARHAARAQRGARTVGRVERAVRTSVATTKATFVHPTLRQGKGDSNASSEMRRARRHFAKVRHFVTRVSSSLGRGRLDVGAAHIFLARAFLHASRPAKKARPTDAPRFPYTARPALLLHTRSPIFLAPRAFLHASRPAKKPDPLTRRVFLTPPPALLLHASHIFLHASRAASLHHLK